MTIEDALQIQDDDLRAVSVKNGAPRTWVDFVQICDYVYELGFGEKL